MAIVNQRTRKRVFEISSANGLISDYALCKARGEGGKPDPKLKALLAHYAQRLKEKQEMAKLVKQCQQRVRAFQSSSPGGGFSTTSNPPVANFTQTDGSFP